MRTAWMVLSIVLAVSLAWADAPVKETSLADQTEVAVTAYNSGLALVRDVRKVAMPSGPVQLKFADVAQQIRPETVSLRSLSTPGSVAIVEQNYEYDLMSPAKMMEKYVGKPVRLVNFSTEIGFQSVDAELLSINDGPIYKVNNEIYLGHPGTVVLPQIPENLIAKPSLIWLLENAGQDQQIEVSYLTGGVSWQADYVVTLAKDDATLDLAGWVTLRNDSGATYTDATLKLVAGDVNVVQPEPPMMAGMGGVAELKMAAAPMREEAFGEYHLYSLPRKTTIKQNQSKQVSLLTASGVKVEKLYEFRGNEQWFFQRMPPMKDQKVNVFLKFKNAEANSLGIPLPEGVMRVYQEDSEKTLQFAGEDRIKHTPKDEEVKLQLGNAFDVVGERTQLDFQRIADRVHESVYEIKVRNHKTADIKVDVIEPFMGDWEIIEKSHDFVKKDYQTAVFTVPVPKDGETIVKYRVRVTY